MQEKQLFEYAIIRVVPRVEREEFLNVGVIVYCAGQSFLHTVYELNESRLICFYKDIDIEELNQRLQAFDFVCKGIKEGGPIAQLPLASRFRWLTSTRSTIVQTSAVHPGLCNHPRKTLEKLYEQMVK